VHTLTHLLDNAVKYSPSGSELWVRSALDVEAGVLELSVADHKLGITSHIWPPTPASKYRCHARYEECPHDESIDENT
jgi:signal transduction histidine kinase